MQIKKISVTVSKKVSKKTQDNIWNGWGLEYGATADLSKKDEPIQAIVDLDDQLRELIAERLGGGKKDSNKEESVVE